MGRHRTRGQNAWHLGPWPHRNVGCTTRTRVRHAPRCLRPVHFCRTWSRIGRRNDHARTCGRTSRCSHHSPTQEQRNNRHHQRRHVEARKTFASHCQRGAWRHCRRERFGRSVARRNDCWCCTRRICQRTNHRIALVRAWQHRCNATPWCQHARSTRPRG